MMMGIPLADGGWFQWVGWGYCVVGLLLGWVMVQVVKAVGRVWWTPRRLERALRQQGIGGNPYRLLVGDTEESFRQMREAMLKPMPSSSSHDIASRVAPFYYKAMKTYGKISFTWSGSSPRVTIVDPVLMREILTEKFGDFGKPKPPILRLYVTGLSAYEGEKWARHRKIINPAFHLETLKLMLPAFSTCCTEVLSRWEKLLGPDGSCELDVWPELEKFSGEVISHSAFGGSFEEGRRVIQLQEEQAQLVIRSFKLWQIPGYRYLPTKKNRRMREIFRQVGALLREVITKKEKAMQTGSPSNSDLLGLLLESSVARVPEDGKSKRFSMTTEEVIEECKLFFGEGQANTAELLTWAMVALGMNPSWQERAREEVLQVFGQNRPSFDGMKQLKLVTMILYEVLRLYPSVTFIQRLVCKTTKLGGYTFPPGVHLILPILFIHHDPEFWGEDVHEFKPERFADGISKASENQLAFFPFSAGPRTCMGQNFAMVEAKLFLATLLQRFSFNISFIRTCPLHGLKSSAPTWCSGDLA